MSSTSDFNPVPFTLPLRRSSGQALPQAHRLRMVEWNKLFAEATEKDTQEGVEIDDVDDASDECDCESHESNCDGNEEFEMNEKNSEMPLNLCFKSNTVPNMNTQFEMSDNNPELILENHCKTESGKPMSSMLPSIESSNKDFVLSKKSSGESGRCMNKQQMERKKDENDGVNKVIGISSSYSNYSNRTPMKEVNYLESNVLSERKKTSLCSDQILNGLEKNPKQITIKPSYDNINER